MRKMFTYRLVIFFIFFVSASYTRSFAQEFYVVVGTFSDQERAEKFTGYVRSEHRGAEYKIDLDKKYFYVYVLKTTDHNVAMTEAKRLQEETEFKGAWVFSGKFHAEQPAALNDQQQYDVTVKPADSPPIIPTPEPVADTVAVKKELPVAVVTPEPEIKVRGKLFKFVIETTDGKPVVGDVHEVDFRRGREIASYKSDKYNDILFSRDNNPMTMVCGIFGYKEVIKLLDYNNPSLTEGAATDAKGAWIIPYKIERMKKGDVSVMYHVAFYKDAVIMLPPSKGELDELVNMMRDNPNYKIKIHGHCNGNNSRRIIALGKTKNYFDVKGSNEVLGTAKELTKLRAQAIQTYLSDNGIDESRSQIFPWGALNMLVAEGGNSSRLNDRIEIEIQQD